MSRIRISFFTGNCCSLCLSWSSGKSEYRYDISASPPILPLLDSFDSELAKEDDGDEEEDEDDEE